MRYAKERYRIFFDKQKMYEEIKAIYREFYYVLEIENINNKKNLYKILSEFIFSKNTKKDYYKIAKFYVYFYNSFIKKQRRKFNKNKSVTFFLNSLLTANVSLFILKKSVNTFNEAILLKNNTLSKILSLITDINIRNFYANIFSLQKVKVRR